MKRPATAMAAKIDSDVCELFNARIKLFDASRSGHTAVHFLALWYFTFLRRALRAALRVAMTAGVNGLGNFVTCADGGPASCFSLRSCGY